MIMSEFYDPYMDEMSRFDQLDNMMDCTFINKDGDYTMLLNSLAIYQEYRTIYVTPWRMFKARRDIMDYIGPWRTI